MTKRISKFAWRAYPWLSAGVLLQTGGCNFNFNELLAGLTTSIVNALITDIVFGVFNVGAGF
jgi:hypothetical protein